jgi:hypothetical protein
VRIACLQYPHQIAVWYALYRIRRNHPRLPLRRSWEWYLQRAANTTIRLGYARIGYMDGTVTREVLRAILEEASITTAQPNIWSELGESIRKGERSRAQYFKSAPNPYGSEFSYDTTGQEEVVVWQLYFGYDADAARTVDHVLQYMRPIPNWAYNGGAVAGDVANGGKWLVTAGTGRGDYGKMHYRAGLNQIPLIEWYRRHPDDVTTLEVAVGAMSGQMGNIDSDGAPSIYFHAYPHVMEYDAYSGDYGLGFFGSSLEASATLVFDPHLGPICYLCDVKASAHSYTVVPRDAYRQRVYIEPLGTYIQADSGIFESVQLRTDLWRIVVTFAPAAQTPAGVQTYTTLRLRVDKVSQPEAKRPGNKFSLVSPSGAPFIRGAYEIPAIERAVTAVVEYEK